MGFMPAATPARSLGKAILALTLLPVRIAARPALTSVPPDARRHFRLAAREALAAFDRRPKSRQANTDSPIEIALD